MSCVASRVCSIPMASSTLTRSYRKDHRKADRVGTTLQTTYSTLSHQLSSHNTLDEKTSKKPLHNLHYLVALVWTARREGGGNLIAQRALDSHRNNVGPVTAVHMTGVLHE
mmetsp:Transcript_6867/g.14103  ORF Transcript_6867/g.14103 Transcript_6867/m.14103 type:complete len:111 (+) Transcript_6867:344-676(+)